MISIIKKILPVLLMFIISNTYSQHVILVSIDGLRPEYYKDASWGMVNIRQAMHHGAYADGVQSVFPSVTYPSHTTIITGVKPAQHGIYYNTPLEPLNVSGKWYWEYEKVKVPTIWTAARQAGLKTAGVNWPVTVNAPIDYNIPEYWLLPDVNGVKPPAIAGMQQKAHPEGLMDEVQEFATGKLSKDGFDMDYYSSDMNFARMGAYIMMKYKPAFLAIHISNVDHFAHVQGREGEKVRAAVADADRAVKILMDAVEKAGIKDSTTFIITGDHGFADIHTQLFPNVLLAENGIINASSKQWKGYFHTAGASAFLHVKDKDDKNTIAQVRSILNKLPEAQKRLFRIVERNELDVIGADPSAVLALAPVEGVTFGHLETGKFMGKAQGGMHGYFPDTKNLETGFVAFGKNIQSSTVIPQMRLEDISPLIAHLLQISLPSSEGILYPGLIKTKP